MSVRPRAVVLAAGLGTRLRPLTDLVPKALCPVANVALVDLAIERVAGLAEAVAVNVHAGREQMEAHLAPRAGRDHGSPGPDHGSPGPDHSAGPAASGRVHLSVEEPEALGTAGALGRLRPWLDGRPVLVTNADAWHRLDLAPLLEGWDGRRPRLLVVGDPARGDFGPWRYAGTALLPWVEVAHLEAVPSGLYETMWKPHWERGTLDLCAAEGAFFDCGMPPDYLAANLAANGGESVVGPGSVVEGELVRSVVWPGGVVAAGERLVESIRVGRDLTVSAPLRPSP